MQLADVLAEIEVAFVISRCYQITLDKKTGVGEKDSDIWIQRLGLYAEVKNFQHGRSDYQKHMARDAERIMGTGGQFMIDPTGKLLKIGDTPGLSSLATTSFDASKQFLGLIKDADSKFHDTDSAILFVTGVSSYREHLKKALGNWLLGLNKSTALNCVIAIGARSVMDQRHSFDILRLNKDPVSNKFIKKLKITK